MEEDYFLNMLVWRVETSEFRTDITLTIGGMILMGDMISEREFCEGLAASVPAEHRDFFLNLPTEFDGLAARYAEEGTDPMQVREELKESFIHLTNVRTFENGEYHQFLDTFWRGKVSTVNGYWLGTLSPNP